MGTVSGNTTFYIDGNEVGEIKEMELTEFSYEELNRYWPVLCEQAIELTGKMSFWDYVSLCGIKRIGPDRKLSGKW